MITHPRRTPHKPPPATIAMHPRTIADTQAIQELQGDINLVLGVRESLRREKNFQQADEIRAKLTELGIALEDTPTGTIWKRKR